MDYRKITKGEHLIPYINLLNIVNMKLMIKFGLNNNT